MAALCPGVQYGLSSQESFGDNKELIFVKLTDSALRTIEEYLRNQTSHTRPTIQFLGNEGHFSFPTQNGSTKFNFSVSSTSDMEGPGGSFECLQQSPRGSLNGLGPIPHKIRVAANDDVYDQTRHRMSMLEENAKNKSTREIEMNRTDIGRKVKVKQIPGRPIPPPPPRRETPPSSRDSIGAGGGSSNNSSGIASNKPSYPPTLPSSISSNKPSLLHNGSSNGLSSNGLGSNHVSSSKPPTKSSLPEIARRPIKERMIHLLALRPYKKPELFDRLVREGLREKKAMMAVLKQIAYLKDNCYHLNRAMFNDVHEDWPFYNESERQILKRRKPENLTPPGSSDGGSSGSGHSPTSTHPGSPPPVSSSSKRPGYYECADGSQSKRHRISHYRKPSEQPSYRSPAESNTSQRRPMTDARDLGGATARSRESPTPPPPPTSSSAIAAANIAPSMNNGYHHHTTASSPPTSNNGYIHGATNAASITSVSANAAATTTLTASSMLNDKRALSDDEDLPPHHSHHHSSHSSAAAVATAVSSNRKRAPPCDSHSSVVSSYEKQPPVSSTPPMRDPDGGAHPINGGGGGGGGSSTRYKVSSSTPNAGSGGGGGSNRVVRVSPDSSQWDRCVESTNDSSSGKSWKKDVKTDGYPDYLHEYTGIKDKEQRKRYKTDFNANYAEYRELHGVVERVSKRFAQLKERLKKENNSSPRYKDIKKQIVREYELSKKDCEHQSAKQRFQYLHDKLSHIKRLVTEYDQMMADSQY